MEAPKLLALMAMVEAEGLTGQAALDRLQQLASGHTVPDEPVSDEIERRARNSKLQHEAYIAWIRQED